MQAPPRHWLLALGFVPLVVWVAFLMLRPPVAKSSSVEPDSLVSPGREGSPAHHTVRSLVRHFRDSEAAGPEEVVVALRAHDFHVEGDSITVYSGLPLASPIVVFQGVTVDTSKAATIRGIARRKCDGIRHARDVQWYLAVSECSVEQAAPPSAAVPSPVVPEP